MKKNAYAVAMLVLAVVVLHAAPVHAASTLRLQSNDLILERNGTATRLPAEEFQVTAVLDGAGNPMAGLHFCGVEDEAGKQRGIKPGLYLFGAKGDVVGFLPMEEAATCGEVRLSPGKTALAVDRGTWTVRTWTFFTYPGLKPLGEVVYYQGGDNPAMFWDGDDGVFFSSIEMERHKRACGYDPCGPVSVRLYSLKDRTTKTLLAGTDKCDFILTGFSPESGMVEAANLCQPSAKAWKEYPDNVSPEMVTVKAH